MIGNKSVHGTLHNGADLYAGLRRCLFQYVSVIPGHGSDEMNRVMLIVVLFYVAVEKGFEGIEHQRMYFGHIEVRHQERRYTGQEPVGERLL